MDNGLYRLLFLLSNIVISKIKKALKSIRIEYYLLVLPTKMQR